MTDLENLVRARAIIVCVGSGGVGKTTLSAAIALKGAQLGRTACVVTIDPAKRLANAMGLASLGNVPARIEDARFESAGIPRPAGQLWAMMLDAKRTWDDLVLRFASDRTQAQRILDNAYYRQISSALAGSQEFMAMERLCELHETRQYDLIVLDTPPTRHALDFLDAPAKMMGFMDERVLELLLTPSRIAGRLGRGLLRGPTTLMFKALQHFAGFDVLRGISDFVDSFSGMHGGFRDRARRVQELLRARTSSFLLVTSPAPLTVDETTYFYEKLVEYRMPVQGLLINRVHLDALDEPGARAAWEDLRTDPSEIFEALHVRGSPDLAARIAENLQRLQTLAEADAVQVDRLKAAHPGPHLWQTVPVFGSDICDLSGLVRVNEWLFPSR